MYGRTTYFRASDIEAVEAQLEELGRKSSELPGQTRSQVVWNDDGSGMVMAIYDSEESAKVAAAGAAEIWGSLMPLLEEPPKTTEYTNVHVMK